MTAKKKEEEKTILSEDQEELSRLMNETRGFEKLSDLLKELTGINLPMNSKNLSLMANRMRKVLRVTKHKSYKEFLRQLDTGDPECRQLFINALTTNTTHFFREGAHFEFLKDYFPKLIAQKKEMGSKEIRIWCAAASTGAEVYTTMMVLHESVGHLLDGFTIRFLASDIDKKVLRKATIGVYTKPEMEGVPPVFVQKYFQVTQAVPEKKYRVAPILQKGVTFAHFNLMTDVYPFQNPFDIVLCRNVLIYFSQETALKVVEKIIKSLSPGGLLFLGHSEFGIVRLSALNTLAHSVFEKRKP